jgi:hypothetical protein
VRLIPCFAIQARRAATSLKRFVIARDSLLPAKTIAKMPPSSIRRSGGRSAHTPFADLGEKVRRQEMAMNVDDHSGSPTVLDWSRAAAIMSASCAILIG